MFRFPVLSLSLSLSLLGMFGTPLAAQGLGSPPNTSSIPCPDIGVVKTHELHVEVMGFSACDKGMIEFEFGGVKITWDDPVCPLFIVITPTWNEIGEKHGTTVTEHQFARGMKFNYACDDKTDNCVQTDIDDIGIYVYNIDSPCTGGPPPPPVNPF